MFRRAEHPPPSVRTALYVPGNRPNRIRTALGSGADAVVIDLEDAVAPDAKDAARRSVAEVLAQLRDEVACQVHVRCNRTDAGWDPADLDVAVHPAVDALRLAKAEDPDQVRAVARAIRSLESARGLEPGSIALDLLVESAVGVLRAPELITADPRTRHLCLGSADLLRDLGASRVPGEVDPLLLARQTLVLAARAAGRPGPIDSVCTDLDDEGRVHAEAVSARALGYAGKSVIHPRQIAAVHRAFAPSDAEVAWAARVHAAWDQALAVGDGTAVVDGEFVDAPVAARAARLLSTTSDTATTSAQPSSKQPTPKQQGAL